MMLGELSLSKDDEAASPIGEWSRRLGIPAATLLHHAGCGELKLFFLASGDYALRYVSIKDIDLASYGGLTPPPVAAEALIGSPCMAGRIYGIYLDTARCAELSRTPLTRVTFHTEVMRNTLSFIVPVHSGKDSWGRDLPADTRLATFPLSAPAYFTQDDERRTPIAQLFEKQAWNRSAEEYLRTPVSFPVRATQVWIRDVDMADFLARIRSFAFIHDMFDGQAIADALPGFVSKKLAELVAANRLFWSEPAGLNPEEREARRKEVLAYLSGDFRDHCNKQSNAKSLMKFAAAACDPHLVPQRDKISLAPSVTPTMLALLTASKLFWAPGGTVGGTADPDRAVVIAFLRSMGLRVKNEAEAGATLLKPESGAGTATTSH